MTRELSPILKLKTKKPRRGHNVYNYVLFFLAWPVDHLISRASHMGREIAILVLYLAPLVSCEAKGGVLGRNNEQIFNVLHFGAKPGGIKDSTEGFRQAWAAACNFNGRARVVVPAGVFKVTELMFDGPCKAPITFQVTGTVRADSDLSNYPNKGWISFGSIDGFLLTGVGTIDGQGQNVWKYNDCKTNHNCAKLPASLYISKVKNAKLRGIHLVNSMGFQMHITNCYNIRINRLVITAPGDSPNTDGMHISKSQTVKVGKTIIGTGDDCISVGQGASNVTISNVACGPGHGFSVGSLGKLPNEMDVRGVLVKNCTLTGTANGVRIKTWPASTPSRAFGLIFSNIVMNNVRNPIIIDQSYGGRSNAQPSRVKISDVVYRNIKGTTGTPAAVNLMCSKLVPCENLHFSNINLSSNGLSKFRLTSVCTNAHVSHKGIQLPPLCH